MLLSSANSQGWIFPDILDTSVYDNTEWCRNYLGVDLCGGRMYPTGKTDHNKLHPDVIFYELKCEICGFRRWSGPKQRTGDKL